MLYFSWYFIRNFEVFVHINHIHVIIAHHTFDIFFPLTISIDVNIEIWNSPTPPTHTKTHIKISCKNEKEQYSKKDTSLMSAIYIDTTSVEHVNFLFMFAQFLKLSLAING